MSPSDGSAFVPMMRQADQKFCFSCSKLLHVSAGSCPACGANQTQAAGSQVTAPRADLVAARPQAVGLPAGQSMFCYGCGAQIHQAAFACPACGAAQQGIQARVTGGAHKDRTVAIVLAFLLGGIGAHRFYLGSIWVGLLYLVFCWTLIPSLIATVEGIMFISTSDGEFQRKYG